MKAGSQYLQLVMLGTIVFCEDTSEKSITQRTICERKCSNDVQCLKDCIDMHRDRGAKANVTVFCYGFGKLVLAFNVGEYDIRLRDLGNHHWSDPIRVSGGRALISPLTPQKRYQFRFDHVSENEDSQPELTSWFRPIWNYQASKVTNLSVVSHQLEADDPMLLRSVIGFTPVKDFFCSYEVTTINNSTGNRTTTLESVLYEFSVTLRNLDFETTYTVSIRANLGGTIRSDEAVIDFTTPSYLDLRGNITITRDFIPKYLLSTILVVIGIGTGIAVYGYLRIRKRRLSQVDEYEVSPKRLLTTKILGTGAFGIVKLGRLRDDQGNLTNVAVKMLRDDSNENDLRSFLHEIKIMKALDKHPNIVHLLGCCTLGPNPFLVVEYCSRGDLYSYLRKSLLEAKSLVDESKKCTEISDRLSQREEVLEQNCDVLSMPSIDGDYIQVSGFTKDQDTNCDPVIVTVMDMLNFGRQIATGMEFMSSNRIVHRDLATRNILVCCDRTVKISDFGMSRDVYQENVYKKLGDGEMPLKWMAIEALMHQLYSTQSDVWSFGILLWEIVTLGGDPYPGVQTTDLLERLQSGYRMERPENCSIPLYDVMLSCWQTRPRDRPTFTILRQELDKLISVTTEKEYLDLIEDSEGRLTPS